MDTKCAAPKNFSSASGIEVHDYWAKALAETCRRNLVESTRERAYTLCRLEHGIIATFPEP